MSIAMVILSFSTLLTAFSNFFIRLTVEKSSVHKDDAFPYRMFAAAFFVWLFYLSEIPQINLFSIAVGVITGLFYSLMMFTVVTAQSYGPSSLIFSLQNGCSLLPPILLSLIFGAEMGFNYKWIHLIGTLIVAVGFLGAFYQKQEGQNGQNKPHPLFFRYLMCMLVAQTGLIFCLQWSDVLRKHADSSHPLIFSSFHGGEVHGVFPILFTAAFIFSFFLFRTGKNTTIPKNKPNSRQILYGILGGLAGAGGGKVLDMALHHCEAGWENLMIMPLLAVSQIFLCSSFGAFIYKEKVRWFFLFLAMGGIFFSLL